MRCLIADIGGTNSRCGISDSSGAPANVSTYENRRFPDIGALLGHYLSEAGNDPHPARGLLGIAAPIGGDHVSMLNIDWQFSVRELQQNLAFDRLDIVNDFEALAYALPALNEEEITQIGPGSPQAGAPKVVLGPGTGLGVASLVATASGWQAVSGEGGHVTLAAADDNEAEIIARVRADIGHCSAERLISGPGLTYLHGLLHGDESTLTPNQIGTAAAAGSAPACATLDVFFKMLGTVSANLALTLGAFGGIYIGGGIVPRNSEAFVASAFRQRFEAMGRFGDYLKKIPTYLITADEPTLIGLNQLAQRRTTNHAAAR